MAYYSFSHVFPIAEVIDALLFSVGLSLLHHCNLYVERKFRVQRL